MSKILYLQDIKIDKLNDYLRVNGKISELCNEHYRKIFQIKKEAATQKYLHGPNRKTNGNPEGLYAVESEACEIAKERERFIKSYKRMIGSKRKKLDDIIMEEAYIEYIEKFDPSIPKLSYGSSHMTIIDKKTFCQELNKYDFLRQVLVSLGIGRVFTADEKPFKHFLTFLSHYNFVTECGHDFCLLDRYDFKEMILSVIISYTLSNDDSFMIDRIGNIIVKNEK